MMLVGSLVGRQLAPIRDWATLPITTMVVGAAVGILPATQVMQRLGRKLGFLLFMLLGIGTCVLAAYALEKRLFAMFCVASSLLGFTNAGVQQMRFAAMESVALEQGPTAASIVMCGGIVAAFIGPELAITGRHFSAVEYQGSFVLVAGTFVLAGLALLGLQTQPRLQPAQGGSDGASSRSLLAMVGNPAFTLAVASGAVGYVVMTFIMTATPISMHHHEGHSLTDTKWVIQSHIAAMFLPSLITAWLFRWLHTTRLMLIGLSCYGATIVIGLIDRTVMGYWFQLVSLGVGWNFLFVAGTALLPSTHHPSESYRAQGFNDTTIFSLQAIASLCAGWALTSSSWQIILLICLLPIFILLALLVRYRLQQKALPV